MQPGSPGRVERPRWPRCGAMRRRNFFLGETTGDPATRRFQMQGIYGDLMGFNGDLMGFNGDLMGFMVISWEYCGDIMI